MFELITLTVCIVAVILALHQLWSLVGVCFLIAILVAICSNSTIINIELGKIDYFKGED